MMKFRSIPATAVFYCGLLGFLLLNSCGPKPVSALAKSEVYVPADSTRMAGLMEFMAADELLGRAAGTRGLERAADEIIEAFETFGLKPYFSSFRDTLQNFEPTTYNVVGVLPGTNPDLEDTPIIIGAHYDHIGTLQGQPADSIANGANDNASGTITVLEMARYFASKAPTPRPLVFALFSAEEKGLLGAYHLADRMEAGGITPYLVLNFEMTGIAMNHDDYLVYLTGYDKSNLAQVMNEQAGTQVVGLLPQAQQYNLFMRSDNYPFFEKFGIPAHTFSSFDFTNFEHYHQPGDEAALMQPTHMARVVNTLLPLVEHLARQQEEIVKMK